MKKGERTERQCVVFIVTTAHSQVLLSTSSSVINGNARSFFCSHNGAIIGRKKEGVFLFCLFCKSLPIVGLTEWDLWTLYFLHTLKPNSALREVVYMVNIYLLFGKTLKIVSLPGVAGSLVWRGFHGLKTQEGYNLIPLMLNFMCQLS